MPHIHDPFCFYGCRRMARKASRPILLLTMIAVCLFSVSCAAPRHTKSSSSPTQNPYVKCRPVKGANHQEGITLICRFGFEQCNLFTATGKKVVIEAESGEKLELLWTVDWFDRGRLIPRWLFALEYIRPDGAGGVLPAVRIGECHFAEGCNYGEFLAPDANGNGRPDAFSRIIWDSWDYGDDDGVGGYLDHVHHLYELPADLYTVTKYLYHYPAGCKPPVSPPDDACLVRDECKPPHTIFRKEVIESRHLFLK